MEDLPGTSKPSDPIPREAAVQNPPALYSPSPKNIFQRRVTALFAASFAAFSFTTWLLTRTQIAGSESRDAATAEGVVRMQLDAMAQGELQIAYAQFSPQYREEVPYETFQQIATTHGQMFRRTRSRSRMSKIFIARRNASAHHVGGRPTLRGTLRHRADRRPLVDRRHALARRRDAARTHFLVGGRVHLAPVLAVGVASDRGFASTFVPPRARPIDSARRAA